MSDSKIKGSIHKGFWSLNKQKCLLIPEVKALLY